MKRSRKNYQGFTLIELLVVVAIISLLSSIVMASLNSARNKAKDAAVKEGVHQMASVMAMNYNDYGSYCQLQYGWASQDGACDVAFSGIYAPQARQICSSMYNNAAGGYLGSPTFYKIYFNSIFGGVTGCATSYSIMVLLNDGNWYCSGSSGAKGEYAYYGDPPNSNPGCYANP